MGGNVFRGDIEELICGHPKTKPIFSTLQVGHVMK